MKRRYYLVLAALLVCAGCGREEHAEAVRLAKVLKQKQPDFVAANAVEKQMIANTRAWCGGITANGAGRGAALEQNASVADALAKSAVEVSNRLSQVRSAITDQSLNQEYTQGIRADLITELTRRQRFLQDLRTQFEQAAPQFLASSRDKNYKGDSYPGAITKLNSTMMGYSSPEDAVGKALTDLKTKYKLTDTEL